MKFIIKKNSVVYFNAGSNLMKRLSFRFCFSILIYSVFTDAIFAQKTMYRTLGHQVEGSEGRNVAEASDGGYFLTNYIYYASTFVSCVTKLNCAGTKEWELFFSEGNVTLPVEIIPQNDNGCILSFSVQSTTGTWKLVVIRIDASGNTLWTKRLNMHVANATGNMVQDSDGSIYLCGNVDVPATGFRGTAIAKLNSSGNVIWEKHYGESVDHTPRLITVTSNNKVIVAGQAGILSSIFTNIFVFSVNTDGNFIKRKLFTTTYDDEALSICADNSGNFAITGYSYFLNTAWDMMFLKMDGDLNVLQSKFIDGGTQQGEQARYIISSDNNTFSIFGDEGGFNERNPALIKLDADGNSIGAKRYPISPQYTNYIFHGAQCSDGGYLMTGDARPPSQFRIAPFLRTDANGELGCYTGSFPVNVRSEIFTELDTSLIQFNSTPSSDSSPLITIAPLPTSNTSHCQSLIPCGNFSIEQDSVCPAPCYSFEPVTYLANSWNWEFEGGTPSSATTEIPPVVCYNSPGPHNVQLTLTNQFGTFTYAQTVNPDINCPFLIPNILTPDGDGLNDEFIVKDITGEFELKIFNRWGMIIFESEFPGKWWNGITDNGEPAAEGVYFYLLNLKSNGKKYNGTLELIRN